MIRLKIMENSSGYWNHSVSWLLNFSVLSISIGLLSANNLQAREIYALPFVSIQTIYDDNRQLRTERRSVGLNTEAYGVLSSAGANIGVRSDRYKIDLRNRVSINRYQSDLDLDSDNAFIDLTSSYNLTERATIGVTGNYTRDTTLTSELEVTGLVQQNRIREQWTISPNWSYMLTQRQFIQANYTHLDTSYEKSDIGNLFDYTTDVVSISHNYQWTQLLTSFVSASWMEFDIPTLNRNTTQYSVSIGADYQFLPTWSASFMIGERYTQTEITFFGRDFTSSQDGLIFNFSINKEFEEGSAEASYSRSTSATGNGQLQVLEKLQANFTHKITQKLRFSMVGGINVTSDSNTRNTSSNRTYYHVSPSLSWQFNRQTSLSGSYRYRNQKFDREDEAAVSNAVFLTFNYRWDKLSTQRY